MCASKPCFPYRQKEAAPIGRDPPRTVGRSGRAWNSATGPRRPDEAAQRVLSMHERAWRLLSGPLQLRGPERLERVDYVRALPVVVEPEISDRHALGREVGEDEAVLLDRLEGLFHVEMRRRHGPDAAKGGRPAPVAGAERARK